MTAGLTFNNLGWLVPVASIWALASIASVIVHRRERHAGSRVGLGLRLLGLTIVAFALLEPSRAVPRTRPGANQFAVLADDSRSLQLAGAGGRRRGDEVRAQLQGDAGWLTKLGETYQIKRYRFAERLERVNDFHALTFEGRASHLGAALRTLADRWKGAPLAGVVLLTDGNATDDLARLGGAELAGLPPIYPVLAGDTAGAVDLAVTEVTANDTLFEDAPTEITARVEAVGASGAALSVELRDATGLVLETRDFSPDSAEAVETFRFRVKPSATPTSPTPPLDKSLPVVASTHHTVVVRPTRAGSLQEATAANNARSVVVPRPHGKSRLLYVGGRPSWEYKFLSRSLKSDPALELVALVRLAPREPRFAFLTRKGESVNPLFRGFGTTAEDAERFDEPVLQRLGTRDAEELRAGFPRTAEELFDYQAVLLDDVEAGFFTAAQQALVERFVAERGGGLVMLGGVGSFAHGGYARTRIGDLLPVYLDRPVTSPAVTPARYGLSREGWLEAWMRLADNEEAERARLAAIPGFQVVSVARGIKPGASVLATLTPTGAGERRGDDRAELPALVVQRAGEGRVAALTVGDLWRWGLRRAPNEADDLGKFWRQFLRAVVRDVPRPITATLAPSRDDPATLAVSVRVRGRDYRPADDARLEVDAIAPDGRRTRLATTAGSESGVHEAALQTQGAGVHRVEVRAVGADGRSLGEAEVGRAMDLDADEHRSIRVDKGVLATLAAATGGEVIPVEGLAAFVDRLKDRPAPLSDLELRPLWHSPFVWLLALACLAAEWTLRRRGGQP